MHLLTLLLLSLAAFAQTPNQSLDKAPQDVDDALRARIKLFYDFHVAGKFRQAEQVIAEDSKDDFYNLSKPEIRDYKIGNVEYSENFTKAKVVIVGSMPVLLPMAGGKIMEMPFASYWKIEDGKWCWYYNKEVSRHTPFGDIKESALNGPRPTALPTAPVVSIAELQSALKIDRTRIDIDGDKTETLHVTNTLPGPASITISCPTKPLADTGLKATFDKTDLKGNETATLSLAAGPKSVSGVIPLQITVNPTNQILNFTVTVSR